MDSGRKEHALEEDAIRFILPGRSFCVMES